MFTRRLHILPSPLPFNQQSTSSARSRKRSRAAPNVIWPRALKNVPGLRHHPSPSRCLITTSNPRTTTHIPAPPPPEGHAEYASQARTTATANADDPGELSDRRVKRRSLLFSYHDHGATTTGPQQRGEAGDGLKGLVHSKYLHAFTDSFGL